MSDDAREAARNLAALRATRGRLAAARARWPWSRHAAFAGLLTGLSAAQALALPFNVVADGLLAAGAGLVMALDRKRTGVFIDGWRKGPTQWITLTAVLVAVVLGLFGLWLARERGLVWAPVFVGLAIFPMALSASRLWEHIYQRELEGRL